MHVQGWYQAVSTTVSFHLLILPISVCVTLWRAATIKFKDTVCLFTVSPYIDVTFPFFVADIKFYRKVLAKVLFFYNVKNHLQILNVQSHVLFGLCTETCVKMCKIIGSFHIRSINKICFLTSWSPISVKLITAIGYPDFFGDYFFLNLCLCLPKISKKTHEIGVHTIFLMCLSVINRVMLLPSVMFVIWAFDGYIICQI